MRAAVSSVIMWFGGILGLEEGIMGKLGVCLTAGPLLMVLGGYPLLCIFGFASMPRAKPDLEGMGWSTVLGRMFNFSTDAGWITLIGGLIFVFGLFLVVLGLITFFLK